jgi:hypothetical protein
VDDVFCQALNGGDIAAAQARLAHVVATNESMRIDKDPNFGVAIGNLVNWLMESGCIRGVHVSDGLLKTQPPQKVLELTAHDSGGNRKFYLKLRLGRLVEIDALESRDPIP